MACSPTIEKKGGAVSEESSALSDELSDDSLVDEQTTRDRLASSEENPEILLIEPDSDREKPLRDCGSLQKQQEMNACAYENYQAVDTERNEIYQRLEAALSDEGSQALETAELAWVTFRDLDCSFERSQFEGGSIAPLIRNSCLEARTNIRISELSEPAMAESSYTSADSALNAAYQALANVVNEPRDRQLVDAQIAWIEYRDRHCEFEANYGSVDINVDQCKARLSEKRTRQIRASFEQNSP